MSDTISLNVDDIRSWRSIITLIVFVLTNLVVLFPFHIPIFVPTALVHGTSNTLRRLRVIPPKQKSGPDSCNDDGARGAGPGGSGFFTRMRFPLNFVTAPLIADLFLLAILAIGREEVYDGTVGSNNILPIDIMVFFLTLAYIAISIDASGLIRYLAFRVLSWGGEVGHRLFFYLYAFFFALGSFIGNDPIILSGTAFLAYMTRVSSNIEHPRAWIHTQFAVANIASAILVSSNPTNLVLAGAFNIKFIDYTANMIVPVVITAIVLFPCLLYIIFAHERLIPMKITMHELPEDIRARRPVNPNIPHARGQAEDWEDGNPNSEQEQLLSLEEIMNPFLDKGGASFGAVIMTVTLVTVLALNAASQSTGEHPVFWVTLPAAFVMFCWDVGFGWLHRHETREISRKGRAEIETARAERLMRAQEAERADATGCSGSGQQGEEAYAGESMHNVPVVIRDDRSRDDDSSRSRSAESNSHDTKIIELAEIRPSKESQISEKPNADVEPAVESKPDAVKPTRSKEPQTLVSLLEDWYQWCQETFPTVTAVLAHLPFALIPFALSMFVLVEALVTKGWVPVFAYGWDHWVDKTGTVGAIGGMGFLSVILCNFAGTNIGTTILLSRVIQAWEEIHKRNGIPISDRNFWASVYAMALGVNYGAFSTAFSASLAGLLWRDILGRKHIHVRRLEFANVNLPIIAIAMTIGCAVLVGEVYIYRSDTRPYSLG
ncbi:hypothetical protein M406DRAFT_281704 [Cryphonectria parasitica EP155]|uniref:Citrate transporter-like domain-containing protein n=1 Tax=Cryphonectria parasitica (strain ATCC 38755 / EP155) TaxID=660469 RepID=A0A9P4XVN2_CRYP1|nr:uncharacterized protein M406DRAFT_281704 [Cryphonectria parasitica EP155]KAF3761637.1 hypothetical protein M406DRAFT_281704 [Cryphonectria parasitica EP155]